MRITTSMMMARYMRSLNANSEQVSTDTERLSSGRAYLRASENPVDASRMIVTNHQLKTIEDYQDKISAANNWLGQAESTVKSINDNVLTAVSSALQTAASTATQSSDENQINAQALETAQGSLLTSLNAVQGSQYVFGGEADGLPPFKVGAEDDVSNGSVADVFSGTANHDAIVGKLLYLVPATGKYVPVNQIQTGSTYSTDATSASYYNVNNPALSRSMKVDLGMGVQMSNGSIQEGTALDTFTNPLNLLIQKDTSGYNGYNNIYDDLTVTANALRNDDTSTISASMRMESGTQSTVSMSTAAIGEKTKMLSFLSDKFDTDYQNTTDRISKLEDMDTIAGYGTLSLHMMVYQASLAISNTILQNNLTNYLK